MTSPAALRRLRSVHGAVCVPEPAAAGKAAATGDTFQSTAVPAATPETAPFNSRRSPLVAMHGAAASSQPLVAEVGMRSVRHIIPSHVPPSFLCGSLAAWVLPVPPTGSCRPVATASTRRLLWRLRST